jgi:hypothetical protein
MTLDMISDLMLVVGGVAFALYVLGVPLYLRWRQRQSRKAWLRTTASRTISVERITTGQASEPGSGTKNSSSSADPGVTSKYYRAYITETLRLAGIDADKFLADKDLTNGEVVRELIVEAEGYLLLSIVEQLTGRLRPPRPTAVPRDRHLTPQQVHEKYSPTPHAMARELAGDKEVWRYALMLLKKINPILQQAVGSRFEYKPPLS